jgi:hypothetical protein
VLENDFNVVVDVIQANQSDAFEFISRIKLLDLHFNFKVKFIKRQTSMTAQILVRATIYLSSCNFFDFTHCCIENITIN